MGAEPSSSSSPLLPFWHEGIRSRCSPSWPSTSYLSLWVSDWGDNNFDLILLIGFPRKRLCCWAPTTSSLSGSLSGWLSVCPLQLSPSAPGSVFVVARGYLQVGNKSIKFINSQFSRLTSSSSAASVVGFLYVHICWIGSESLAGLSFLFVWE